jgi:hypothetical protein
MVGDINLPHLVDPSSCFFVENLLDLTPKPFLCAQQSLLHEKIMRQNLWQAARKASNRGLSCICAYPYS